MRFIIQSCKFRYTKWIACFVFAHGFSKLYYWKFMFKQLYKNKTEKVLQSSMQMWDIAKSKSLLGELTGVCVRVSGRIKGPIAKKQDYKLGNITSKSFNKPVRNYSHQVRTQVGIIGVRITKG